MSAASRILRPLAIGTALSGLGGAAISPPGEERNWAIQGGLLGAVGTGPFQAVLKRALGHTKALNLLKEIKAQKTKDIAISAGIGTGVGAGIGKLTKHYHKKDKKKKNAIVDKLALVGDDLVDAGILVGRTLKGGRGVK